MSKSVGEIRMEALDAMSEGLEAASAAVSRLKALQENRTSGPDMTELMRKIVEEIELDFSYYPKTSGRLAENIMVELSRRGLGIAPLPYTVEGGKEQRSIIDEERERIEALVYRLPTLPNGYWVEQLSETVALEAVLKIVRGKA